MTEIILAMLGNFKVLALVMAVVVGLVVIISGFAITVEESLAPWKVPAWRNRAALFLVFSVLGCIPDVDDLWKVRIGLLKYELASPENVKGAAETIERIGKKLECKYLGCKDEKENK